MFHCKAFWLLIVFFALFAAAWKSNEPPRAQAPKKSTAPAAPARDEVAAVVNGDKIMLSELLGRLRELGIAPNMHEQAAGDVLDAMINNSLLVQFLAAQKIPYDVKKIDQQIAEVRAEYEKEGVKFTEALASIGLTEQKLRAAAIAEAQWNSYLAKTATDRQLQEYFAKYREFFDGTQVRASHILIEVPAGGDDKTRAAAKAKAERIRKELAGGADFAKTAKKYSDCPSKDQGGDVDYFVRQDKMVEPFAKAAFALQVGELSPVVETEFGYHIIKVTDRKPGTRSKPTDPELRADVLESYAEQLKSEITAKQRKVAKIEIAPESGGQQPKAKTAAQGGKVKK